MYLQTKKVVIIYIVTLITFSSIISSLYRETQDTIPQISIVSSEELSYQVSFAQNVFGDLSIEGSSSEQLARYGSSVYQIANTSSAQFTNIVNSSEMIIVIGDTFNDYLLDQVINNEDKQFVLIENSNDFDQSNVYQINIDYNQVFTYINQNTSDQNPSLVVLTNQYSDLARELYIEHSIASNPNVKLEIIEDTSDVASFKNVIKEDLANGFVNVYSMDPYNNADLLQVITDFNNTNQKLREEAELVKEADSEVDSSLESEVDSESVEIEPAEELKDATLKYLTLNNNDILTNQTSSEIGTNIYDINEQLTKLIDSVTSDKIKQGDIEISITNIN